MDQPDRLDQVDQVERHALLERWFRDYADRVLGYLRHRTDADTAQDVLQEVFVTAFRKAESLPDEPIGWLLGTARRQLANNVRGARRREGLFLRLVATSPEPTTDADDDPRTERVRSALDELSATDREVLTLSAWYDLSADQAAQALGCSRSAYAVRLHRARRRLGERVAALERRGDATSSADGADTDADTDADDHQGLTTSGTPEAVND